MARHKQYPTDVTDEEWSFAAPYLALIDERAAQRQHDLREVFNALRWMARAGAPWRMLPGRCCVNRFLVELPQTPDAAMPRPASEDGPVQ